jgi:uncharacterized protein YwqG
MRLNAAEKVLYQQNLEKAKGEKSPVAKAIYRHKFFLKVADELVALQRNTIVFDPQLVENEDEIKIGASKLGGRPDLPPHLDWIFRKNETEPKADAKFPIKNGEMIPFSFLGQINLAEVKKYDVDDLLPARGRLYFFYVDTMYLYYSGIWQNDEAYNPFNLEVIYDDSDPKTLTRRDFPISLRESNRYQAAKLKFSKSISFPHSDNPQLLEKIFRKTGDKSEAQWLYGEKIPYDKAKGYRQNKMFGHVDAQFPYLNPDQVLLMQFTDHPCSMEFSREGYLCLFMDRKNLKEQNWKYVYFSES